MKLSAFILLTMVVAFMAEGIYQPSPAPVCSKSMSCCKMRMKDHKKKPSKQNGCSGTNCINCPLMYSFTLNPEADIVTVRACYIKLFSPLHSDIFPGVYGKVWRPPNVASL